MTSNIQKSTLSADNRELIIGELAKGTTTANVCKQLGIHHMTFWRWMQTDPSFKKEVDQARIHAAHLQVEELSTIYDSCIDLVDVQRARGQSDNIKWLASKRCPEVYGDRIDLNIQNTVDLGPVLAAAAERAIPFIQMKAASGLKLSPSGGEGTLDEQERIASETIDASVSNDEESSS